MDCRLAVALLSALCAPALAYPVRERWGGGGGGSAWAEAAPPPPPPPLAPPPFLAQHPLLAIHSSLLPSAPIPLAAPPPPDLATFDAVEHIPPRPADRSNNIAVVPLVGLRPFQGFGTSARQPPPRPPPPPPQPPEPVVPYVPTSEIVVVNPEEDANMQWPQTVVQQPEQSWQTNNNWYTGQDSGRYDTSGGGSEWNAHGYGNSGRDNIPAGGGGAAAGGYDNHPLRGDGTYSFSFWTGQLPRGERGYLRRVHGWPAPVLVKEGYYTYSDAAGSLLRVDYVADEHGYRASTSRVR